VKALRKNERQDETQFITEIDSFLNSPLPPLNVNVLFLAGFFLNLILFVTNLSVLMLYFTNNYIISLLYIFNNHTFLQVYIN